MKISIVYLIAMNAAGFFSMAVDKRKAIHHAWRIPEKVLFLIAALGGSLGSLLGIYLFRHKTRHKQFVIGIPLIFMLQVLVIALIYNHFFYKSTVRTDLAMGTVISETVYGQGSDLAAEDISNLIQEFDKNELSWRESSSAVSILNQELETGTVAEVSERTAAYIQDSLSLCADSGGALDITIHPLIDLWGIESDDPAVPSQEAIEEALARTGYTGIRVTDATHIQTDELLYSVDLGAVGKGIAADEVCAYLDEKNDNQGDGVSIQGAVISIGGTILIYGKKSGNQQWQVGIRDPRGSQDSYLGYLSLEGTRVISTSGDYEQYFEQDGVRYHHIFDPSTGYPADSGLMSVTVVCESGLASDGLSTACFVLGYAGSLSLLTQYHAEAVFVTNDYQVYVTDGLRDSFILTSEEYQMGEASASIGGE